MVKFYDTIAILLLFCCYFKTCWSQDNVYEKQYIKPEKTYSLNPTKYSPAELKKWYFSTAPGYELQLSCPFVDMPKIEDGCVDYFDVLFLKYHRTYCNPFTVNAPSIILQLHSTPRKDGGAFECSVTSYKIANQILQDDKPISRSEDDCQCGYRFTGTPRIVGGTDARTNEFPSIAYVQTIPDKYGNYYTCGATIIGPRVAITAAHCMVRIASPKSYQLIVGIYDTSSDQTEAKKFMTISDIIIHNKYNPSSHGVNDLALLITNEKIEFTPEVGPACLPINIDKESIIGKDVIAAGWGRLQPDGPIPNILQKVRLQVETDEKCRIVIDPYYTPSQHVCTITPRKSVAEGDSGGPLYYIDPETFRYTLVGVTSFRDEDKTRTQVVFMDVHQYLSWIEENVPSDTLLCGL